MPSSLLSASIVSDLNRVAVGLAPVGKSPVTISCGVLGSPSCTTHHRPSSSTSESTTAIGQETKVLQKTEIIATRTESIHRTTKLLKRFSAKLRTEDAPITDPARKPTRWPSVLARAIRSKFPP